ncbi:MAG: biotin biosynthesis protein BioY [Clostridia bacterium]|jgi:biotin transport system substrate-specific component|uniref:biotin transporter BioY n=1 Tax=Petroclostridium xylanilyticum TaxID=1792311 RepID=UPI000B98B60A|nr:biotin transporter BioY [Petroclostridium xylanilyticum]MBZ4645353.1 biotin biosynthesis protein BioY [Clostridia bacterium]
MNFKTKDMILVALFAALTAIGGFINIKVYAVPLTLQLFFCSFAGILLGARLGMMSQLIYVMVGLIGIPVFVYGGGPAYVLNPTFGYLIGFIVAAYVMGKIVETFKELSFISMIISVMTGFVIAYAIGIPYFYAIYNFYLGKSLPFLKSITMMTPYMVKDLILAFVVALTAWRVLPILRSTGIVPAPKKISA